MQLIIKSFLTGKQNKKLRTIAQLRLCQGNLYLLEKEKGKERAEEEEAERESVRECKGMRWESETEKESMEERRQRI